MIFRDYEGSVPDAVLFTFISNGVIHCDYLLTAMLMVECIIRHGNKQIEMSYYKRVVLVSVAFH